MRMFGSEVKGEGGPFVWFGLSPDFSTVAEDDPLYNCEPDACAFEFICPVQALKHTKKLVRVLHVKSRAIVLYEIGLMQLIPTDFNYRLVPAPRVFHSVGNEIDENLME